MIQFLLFRDLDHYIINRHVMSCQASISLIVRFVVESIFSFVGRLQKFLFYQVKVKN